MILDLIRQNADQITGIGLALILLGVIAIAIVKEARK